MFILFVPKGYKVSLKLDLRLDDIKYILTLAKKSKTNIIYDSNVIGSDVIDSRK